MSKNGYKFDALAEAYQDVMSKGMAIRKAGRIHGIPESTLRRRLKDGLETKMGSPTLFTRTQEEKLANYCIQMAHIGYGFARWQVMDLANNMVQSLGINNKEAPTKNWFYGFLGRFPELKMMKPKKRERARDVAVTDKTLSNYFVELETVLYKYDILNRPAQIWNVDESGISLDHSPPKILARAGTNPYAVTSGMSANTTIIAAGSALGETLPPYIIFKGERLTKELTAGGMKGTEYRTSPTGWSNSLLFLDFFKNHFLRHVTIRPCLLLYDGHSTHITSDIINKAKEENIHLFVLPPHTSHCLQPLDVSVFSPFKKSLNSEFHKYLHAHPNCIITRELLPKMISTAYNSSLTVSTIMSGFRKSGVFPLDPAAVETSVPSVTVQKESSTVSRKERKDNRTVKVLFQEKMKEFQEKKSDVPEKKARKRFVPPHGAAITEDSFLQQKAKENMEPKPAKEPQRKKVFKTPYVARTEEKQDTQKTAETESSSKKRKANEPTEVNTTTRKPGKGPKENSKRGKGLMKKQKRNELPHLPTEEEDSERCMICGRWEPEGLRLDLAIRFVEWFQCLHCKRWVHKKFCTDFNPGNDEEEYICTECSPED